MGDSSAADLLFDLNDFESLEIQVVLENMTAKTAVGLDLRTIGDHTERSKSKEFVVRLMELRDDGVSLDVPSRSGAVGHIVKIEFAVINYSKPIKFIANGLVSGVSSVKEGRDKFDVTFTTYDKSQFDELKNIFSQRQAQIEDFFNHVKG